MNEQFQVVLSEALARAEVFLSGRYQETGVASLEIYDLFSFLSYSLLLTKRFLPIKSVFTKTEDIDQLTQVVHQIFKLFTSVSSLRKINRVIFDAVFFPYRYELVPQFLIEE